jgi:MFS family permease
MTLTAAIIGFVVYFSIIFLNNPVEKIMYLLIAFIGIGEGGLIVSSLGQVTDSKRVRSEIRGNVAGVYSFCGAIGILIGTKVGGILFDEWKEVGPFFIMACGHLLCGILGLGIICNTSIRRFLLWIRMVKQDGEGEIVSDNLKEASGSNISSFQNDQEILKCA